MLFTAWKQEEKKTDRHRKNYLLWLQAVSWLYVLSNNSLNDSKITFFIAYYSKNLIDNHEIKVTMGYSTKFEQSYGHTVILPDWTLK